MATEADRTNLVALMNHVTSELPEGKKRALFGFLPLRGGKYQSGKGMMVVGRAIAKGDSESDWFEPLPTDRQTPQGIEKYVSALYDWGNNPADPMDWVCKQWNCPKREDNKATSAFWRVIRRVSTQVDQGARTDPECWASHLVWSNLYKLSVAGNPSGVLKRAQEPGCIRTLRMEIEEGAVLGNGPV